MDVEESCNALGSLFQTIVNDMKDSSPAFEDLAIKTTKLHSSLRTAIVAVSAFLEAFQKIADIATNSRGATKEIGKALTRLCLRQKSIESKLKVFTSSLLDGLVVPLQERVSDWQKVVVQLDKDHARDHKKARAEIKRASGDTVRLQRKAKKGKTTYSKGDAKEKLECAMQDVTDKYVVLAEAEKKSVCQALVEERKHYCHFITFVEPVVTAEMNMINEAAHLQEILDTLCGLAADPDSLPEASEQVVSDHLNRADLKFTYHTPPDSPTLLVRSSRKSSVSSLNSLASASEADSAIGISPNRSSSGQKTHSGSEGDLLHGDRSSVSSKHSSYYSGGRSGGGGISDEACDSVSLQLSTAAAAPSHLSGRIPERAQTVGPGGGVSMVNGARALSGRPSLQPDTYVPPPGTAVLSRLSGAGDTPTASSAAALSPIAGELQQRLSSSHSRTPSPVLMPPPPVILMPPPKPARIVMRRDTLHGVGGPGGHHRNLPPRTIRAKPVAPPSVPFMACMSEPVYMNTQELATRIAEKRLEGEQQRRSSAAAAAGSLTASDIAPTSKVPPLVEGAKGHHDALADAIKELEASTAALNNTSVGSTVMESGLPTQSGGGVSAAAFDLIYPGKSNDAAVVISAPTSILAAAASRNEMPVPDTGVDKRRPADITNERDMSRPVQGHAVQNWAGQANLRRAPSTQRPPPPIRKSSSMTSSHSLEAEHATRASGSGVSQADRLEVGLRMTASLDLAQTAHNSRSDIIAVSTADAGQSLSQKTLSPKSDWPSRDSVTGSASLHSGMPVVLEESAMPAVTSVAEESAIAAVTLGVAAVTIMPSIAKNDPIAINGVSVTKAPPPAVATKPPRRSSAVPVAPPAGPGSERIVQSNGGIDTSHVPPWERGCASAGSVTRDTLSLQSNQSSSMTGTGTLRRSSDFMASLTAKLAGGMGTNVVVDPSTGLPPAEGNSLAVPPPAVGNSWPAPPPATLVTHTPESANARSTAVVASSSRASETLLSQIHLGIKLKKAPTGDRSTPRVT